MICDGSTSCAVVCYSSPRKNTRCLASWPQPRSAWTLAGGPRPPPRLCPHQPVLLPFSPAAIVSPLITPLHLISHLIGISSEAGNLLSVSLSLPQHPVPCRPTRSTRGLPARLVLGSPPGRSLFQQTGQPRSRASAQPAPGVLSPPRRKALSCSQGSAWRK